MQVGAAEASGGAAASTLTDDPPAKVVFSSTPHVDDKFRNVVTDTDLTKAEFPGSLDENATDAKHYAFAILPLLIMEEQQICAIDILYPFLLDMSFHKDDPTGEALVGAEESLLGGITTDASGNVTVWRQKTKIPPSHQLKPDSTIRLDYDHSDSTIVIGALGDKGYTFITDVKVGAIGANMSPRVVIQTGYVLEQTMTIDSSFNAYINALDQAAMTRNRDLTHNDVFELNRIVDKVFKRRIVADSPDIFILKLIILHYGDKEQVENANGILKIANGPNKRNLSVLWGIPWLDDDPEDPLPIMEEQSWADFKSRLYTKGVKKLVSKASVLPKATYARHVIEWGMRPASSHLAKPSRLAELNAYLCGIMAAPENYKYKAAHEIIGAIKEAAE